jgi:hypothetical protein
LWAITIFSNNKPASFMRLMVAFDSKQGLELAACVKEMKTQFATLRQGDTKRLEAMLLAQAHSLQAMFTHYAEKMTHAEYLNQLKVNGALALKAQNQCRQTLQVLAEIKNPKRATFIKNHATNQQVNVNGKAEISENISTNRANELLYEESHATMDSRGTPATITAHP